MTSHKSVESKYKKRDLHEHILGSPGMYIGSTRNVCEEQWIWNKEKNVMEKKYIEYNPGLYKIFDEILVNAIDHSVRDTTVNTIKVDIDTTGISVYNDGSGIPIIKHSEYGVYIPELIFGILLTSTSYTEEKRIVGSKNGLGCKLCNIFSKKFIIETVDSNESLYYRQEFSNNMYSKSDPEIKKCKKKSYTKITFFPDFKRFSNFEISDDFISFLNKRVYDCTACTNKNVSIYLNGVKLPETSFLQYIKLFGKKDVFYSKIETNNPKFTWEIGVCCNDTFEHVSFVNGVLTFKGGKHLDYVVNQLTKKLSTLLKEKKKIQNVKPSYIKDRLFIFLRATVQNPDFDSQTKENMTTPSSDFGVKIELDDSYISKIYQKSGITESIISFTKYKESSILAKTTNGKKKAKLHIEKLDDAHFAGTSKSNDCTIILTEGDSAKTFAISGLSVIGRDFYGVFPLRGKPLNVREATTLQLTKNEEINNIKQILGLQHGKKYSTTKELRYGSVLILTDADEDGKSIRGLIINMFHYWWPELLEIKGFIRTMKTPIVKVSKGIKNTMEFYTIQDFKKWEKSNKSKVEIKYYKGLGTSTRDEAKDIFKKMKQNLINYICSSKESLDEAMLLAFERKKADCRKIWLQNYNYDLILDQSESDITYEDFVNKELIHFSAYDVVRSVPSICDGLKPSQRKVLFTMFKKKYTKDIKVAQLSAAVAEMTSYHHGEASLCDTIVNLAQDYVGTNNINLLEPKGQFGTRLVDKNRDVASPRYIFTKLNPITNMLFDPIDSEILDYIDSEGQMIEPKFYVPIIPIILINGARGIGTGYSTYIPCFNPEDIIENMKRILEQKEQKPLVPWYRNFKGKIVKDSKPGSFLVYGKMTKEDSNSLRITELPIETCTENYTQFLTSLVENNDCNVQDYINNSSDIDVDILLKLNCSVESFLSSYDSKEELYKKLKLVKSISTRNYHLFNVNGVITKYDSAEEILEEFVKIRLNYNTKRKNHLISKYLSELRLLSNKIRFLEEIIESELIVYKKSKKEIFQILQEAKYDLISDSYNYLLDMNISSFTKERLEDLKNKYENTSDLLDSIRQKTEKNILLDDLSSLCDII